MDGSIRLKDIHFTYPGATEESLRGADLSIEPGEFVAVIGNNGSGKTSLCKVLNGLIPHFHRGDFSGEAVVAGQQVVESSVGHLAFHVGYVYQDFENQLLRPKVADDVGFAPLNFGLDDYEERAARAIEAMELEALRDRFVWELSGGQKHLAALAGVLALDPSIVVVDEPVAQLDPENARLVYDRLAEINRSAGKTVLVIEHHTEFVAEYCDAVVLLDQGRVQWKLPVTEALNRTDDLVAHDIYPPQITQIATALPSAERTSHPVRLHEAVDWLRVRKLRLTEPAAVPLASAEVNAPAGDNDDALVMLDELTHRYPMLDRSRREVLSDLSLTIAAGENVALVGSNGAGKSTILRLLAGIIRPTMGTVRIAGHETGKVLVEELNRDVSLVFQNSQEMFIEDSVERDVSYFPRSFELPEAEQLTGAILERFRLTDLAERDARLLSGGQQRRVSLAIGAVSRPSVLLMDEPTSSLDIANRRDVLAMLGELSAYVRCAIVATHDMELVAEWATRVIVLEEGRLVADDTPREVFSDPDLVRRARVRLPQVTRLCHELELSPVALTVDEFVARSRAAAETEATDA